MSILGGTKPPPSLLGPVSSSAAAATLVAARGAVGDVAAKRPLAGRGTQSNLLHYLWQHDKSGASAPGIHIPHTVIYRQHNVDAWFFSGAGGGVKRKPPSALHNLAIEEALAAGAGTSDVVACYVDTHVMDSKSPSHAPSSSL